MQALMALGQPKSLDKTFHHGNLWLYVGTSPTSALVN
jgi:hypothetical protein